MKIKLLTSIASMDYCYQEGKTYEVAKELASELTRAGVAVLVPEEKRTKKAEIKPDSEVR